jgi:hypothetical protein
MMVELMLERICWLRTIRGGFFVPTITPTDLERATWHHFMHGYASDHSTYVFRCSLSPRLTREVTIYRGRKREPRLEWPPPLNTDGTRLMAQW